MAAKIADHAYLAEIKKILLLGLGNGESGVVSFPRHVKGLYLFCLVHEPLILMTLKGSLIVYMKYKESRSDFSYRIHLIFNQLTLSPCKSVLVRILQLGPGIFF